MKIALLLLMVPCQLWANGGGYFRSGLGSAGSITLFEPSGTQYVQIVEETLTIDVGTEYAEVSVDYRMKNTRDRTSKVEFGFPVENMIEIPFDEGVAKPVVKKNYCENYRISIGGKDAEGKLKWREDVQKIPEPNPASEGGGIKGIAAWLVSRAEFNAGEEKEVKIRFRSPYPLASFSVSDNNSAEPTNFVYRLSSAACWAGSIAKCRIIINIPQHIDPREVNVIKPVNRFQWKGNQLLWEFENLEPTFADDLTLQVCPKEDTYIDYVAANSSWKTIAERGGKWEIRHQNFKAKASSTLPDADGHHYGVKNLIGFGEHAVWSEGANGSGVGEWLDITPDVPTVLRAVILSSGYPSGYASGYNDDLFKKNARPKRMTLILNGEKSYDFPILDTDDEQRFFLPDYAKPVQSIKMTFTEVYPGSKYEDMCVNSFSLVSGLSKKPVIPQCR